jgi:hypothetical protein
MARRVSLHIGLNSVDPGHYQGWDGTLAACEFDANDMQALATAASFDETSVLLTADANADAVLGGIQRAAGQLGAGDYFLLTYSGHGGQVPDRNNEEEGDHSDETWVAYDRQIVDDELYALFGTFQPGVRIFMLSDSCHSGSVNKAIQDEDAVPDPVRTREAADRQSPRLRAMPRDVMVSTYRAHQDLYNGIQEAVGPAETADPAATVLLISGCRDDQLSSDGFSNGLFTEHLRNVWNDGGWNGGGHPEFHEAIRSGMPPDQQPVYSRVGAQDDQFEAQKPFAAG